MVQRKWLGDTGTKSFIPSIHADVSVDGDGQQLDADVSLPLVFYRCQDRKKVGWLFTGRDTPANDIRRESPLVFAHRVNFLTLTTDIPSALHSVMHFFHSELCAVDISEVDNVLSNLGYGWTK